MKECKTIKLNAKCSDMCWYELEDADGNQLADHDGYVPSWMPGQHFGDYIELEIDRETGMIKNWKRPTDKALKDALED